MKARYIKQLRSLKTLEGAWRAIRKNARSSKLEATRLEALEFDEKSAERLDRILRALRAGKFVFEPSEGKKIKKKSGFRPLVVAPLESRIVQRAVHDVLVDVPALQSFVKTRFSFGGIRKDSVGGCEGGNLSAVPAAVKAALDAIGEGMTHIVKSDISAFFTRIPKPVVTKIVADALKDSEFIDLFEEAIKVELKNLASLRGDANSFPIHEIGVAQGNSLSPLLGNMFLAELDNELNSSANLRCIRYIDDLLILAPTAALARKHFKKAKGMLFSMGLETSEEKTVESNATKGFTFLGIELVNGLIRPEKEARERLLSNVTEVLNESCIAIQRFSSGGSGSEDWDSRYSVLNTHRRLKGVIDGWSKHYWFCNDRRTFDSLDTRLDVLFESYRRTYSSCYQLAAPNRKRLILGAASLAGIDLSRAFIWPKRPL